MKFDHRLLYSIIYGLVLFIVAWELGGLSVPSTEQSLLVRSCLEYNAGSDGAACR